MERKLNIPNGAIASLKCNLCHGYLSVPPISFYKDKNACGRCNPEWERNVVYEQLAKYVTFPCIYCDNSYPWGTVQNHEIKCRENRFMCPPKHENLYKINDVLSYQRGEFHRECHSRIIRCPFELCLNTFEIKNILEHFNQFHKDYIFSNSVEANKILKEEKVWNFRSDTQVCLIIFNTIPFLLFVHNDCEFNDTTGDISFYNYYFSVFTFCLDGSNTKYSVSLQSSAGDDITDTRKKSNQKIQIFNDKVHCVSFLRRDLFKLNSFDFMTTKLTQIDRNENLVLRYTIQVIDNFQMPLEKCKDSRMFELVGIEKNFECPICKEYMSPPIYNCNTGHTICRNCRDKLTMCPYCQAVISNSRNFVLEDILETLSLHCHNEFKGCTFLGIVQDVKLHEVMCHFN